MDVKKKKGGAKVRRFPFPKASFSKGAGLQRTKGPPPGAWFTSGRGGRLSWCDESEPCQYCSNYITITLASGSQSLPFDAVQGGGGRKGWRMTKE